MTCSHNSCTNYNCYVHLQIFIIGTGSRFVIVMVDLSVETVKMRSVIFQHLFSFMCFAKSVLQLHKSQKQELKILHYS